MRKRRSPAADGLATGDEVIFFPSLASWNEAKSVWDVDIHGWIFDRRVNSVKRKALLSVLRRSLRLSTDDARNAYFQRRAQWFFVKNKSKRITIQLGGTSHLLDASDKLGHVKSTLHIPSLPRNGWTSYKLAEQSERTTSAGRVLAIDPRTIVVSDIDDTLKVSHVGKRRELLKETFLRPYRSVPGMADLYNRWSQTIPDVLFYYVSATPWPLYSGLSGMLAAEGFPEGVIHLKPFRWKDRSFFSLFQSPEKFKTPILEALAKRFPRSSLILIGDSGERDPEIYGAFARSHPDRVQRVYIREVTDILKPARYARAFVGLAPALWSIFRNPEELS